MKGGEKRKFCGFDALNTTIFIHFFLRKEDNPFIMSVDVFIAQEKIGWVVDSGTGDVNFSTGQSLLRPLG